MPKALDADVTIIGAGTAGLTAFDAVVAQGKRALLIDEAPHGTTCARVGCMPSKLLVQAANSAQAAREADAFGVHCSVAVDSPGVMRRVREMRDYFTGFVLEKLDRLEEGVFLRGRARMMDRDLVAVDDRIRIHSRSIVLATGTRPHIPDDYEPFAPHILTSDAIFELEKLPSSILVVGAGVLGLELGQALSRLGVRTTVLGKGGNVGFLTDPDIKLEAEHILSAGLDLHTIHRLLSIEPAGNGVNVSFESKEGRRHSVGVEKLLIASGRRPNLEALNLESIGLALQPSGIPRYNPETLQAGDGAIFIAGDLSGSRPVLHEAAFEGRLAGTNAALFPNVRTAQRQCPIQIAFTQPQMAVVGQSYGELAAQDIAVGKVSFKTQGRARIMGAGEGCLRLYADASSRRLLGAEMIAPEAEHLAHLLAWCIQQHLSADEALRLPFYHPTLEESLRTAIKELFC